jgi:signal transduction histidine kinase/CheY-like chemotaxis protein
MSAQPALEDGTLGLFSHATVDLFKDPDHADLGEHLKRLAELTRSDLVLLYEGDPDADRFSLLAAHGLPTHLLERFSSLGEGAENGACGWRHPVSHGAEDVTAVPVTADLARLGIKGCWAGAVRLAGRQIGTLFVGSRRWKAAHSDTTAVIAATSAQLAWVLAQRQQALSTVSSTGAVGSLDDARVNFISVLAHELRNPVAPIRSGIELLSRGKVNDAVRVDTLAMMQRQMAHLVRLMDDLLDTARLTAGRLPVHPQPVELRKVLETAIESQQPALRLKAQSLVVHVAPGPAVVWADPVRLSQAFANILDHHIEETPPGGTIRVTTAVCQGTARLTFADEGPGPDARAWASDGRLGLVLVRGLIELHGGTVELGHRPHRTGSLITVSLPVTHLPAAGPDVAPASGLATAHGDMQRVLIVDDNKDAAEILKLLFELDGKTIHLAHDGPAAVSEAARLQPDIILMDMGLPGFSGMEAVRQIRALQPAVRPYIIALTGWGSDADRQATRDAGVDLHLVKPIPYPDLAAAIAARAADPARPASAVSDTTSHREP